MFYLTCTLNQGLISSVDLAYSGASWVKDWVSMDCGTIYKKSYQNTTTSALLYKHAFMVMWLEHRTLTLHP